MNTKDMRIPDFLIGKKIWLVWRYEEKNGKMTKVPYMPILKKGMRVHAKSNDPETWSTFEDVAEAENFDGIGIFFDGSFTGIDLDHCIDDENEINYQARTILEMCDSYAEISPSGNGIHILIASTIDHKESKSKDKTVEFYSSKMVDGKLVGGRFFTFTGKVFPGYYDLKENRVGLIEVYMNYISPEEEDTTKEIRLKVPTSTVKAAAPVRETPAAKLSVEEVYSIMQESKLWPQIQVLMDGDITGYNGDDSAADIALCNHLAFFTRKDPVLMDTIFRNTALYRSKWDEKHGSQTYGEITIDKACSGTERVYRGKTFSDDDIGNSDRFVRKYKSDLRYCEQQQTWYIWNGNYWEQDLVLEVLEMAKAVSKEIRDEERIVMAELKKMDKHDPDFERVKELRKALHRSAVYAASRNGLNNILTISKANPAIRIKVADIDNRIMKLNAIGQTLDFKGGRFIHHNPIRDDLLTKCCGCTFDRNRKSELWNKFIREIFDNDAELAEYVQKAVGYSLIGRVNEKCFFFLYGADGDNGKSVFLNVIRKMFGTYGQQASISTFMKSKIHGEIRDDLVNLKGSRFVTAVEPDETARFDMEVMKPLTGSDPIRCRTLHQRQIEYLPEAKLWIAGNNRPLITETNSAAWDRVRVIPFLVSFKTRKDRFLEDKLTDELSGILNWAIEGYKKYVRDGLKIPRCMDDSADDYKKECNSLLSFVDLHCVMEVGKAVSSADFYTAYTNYCLQEGLYAINMRKVKSTFKMMGVEQVKGKNCNMYRGINLKNAEEGYLIDSDMRRVGRVRELAEFAQEAGR